MPQHPRRSLTREIAVLRQALRSLDHSLRRLGPALAAGLSRGAASQNGATRQRPRLSAKARAALKLQGRYMGYVRQLRKEEKVRVKLTRESKGVRAAIDMARKLTQR